MGAAKNDGVYLWIYAHELVYTLLYEIVGSRTVCFLILNQRYPKGASYSAHLDVGIEFGYLQIITLTLDGAFGGQHAHMTTLGEMTNNLGSGTNDAQHTAHGIQFGQVILLNGAQSLGRGCIAAKDYQLATTLKELDHSLTRKLIYHIKRTRAIGRTGIVAKIKIVILWQQLTDAMQYGQTAIAAIENAYGTWTLAQLHNIYSLSSDIATIAITSSDIHEAGV